MATRQKSKQPRKAKKLKVAELRSIAKALQTEACGSAGSQLKEAILESIGKSKQLTVFPERQRLYNLLFTSARPAYDRLVTSLLEDYSKNFASIRGQTQYMDFQLTWLDHVRRVGEQGYVLSTSDAQPLFDGENDSMSTSSESVDAWGDIVSSAFAEMNELSPDSSLIMLHTIAREIFTLRQQEVYKMKQNAVDLVSVPHPAPSPDDSLFRMCGAEVARMVNIRKGRLHHTNTNDSTTQSIERQIQLLHKICIPNEDKARVKDSIPSGIQELDRGYMYVPLPSLKPFPAAVDRTFTQHVNKQSYLKHGHQLFKVADVKLKEEIIPLFELFKECVGNAVDCDEVEELHRELVTKMFNLRKEDWKRSVERITLDEKGKTSSVTLMLRDELKPIAASQKN